MGNMMAASSLLPLIVVMIAGIDTAAGGTQAASRQSLPIHLAAEPFALSDVALTGTSPFGIAQERNREFILSLNSSQLACQYTSAANLTRCAAGSSCPSAGGLHAPVCNPLPGEMGLGGYYGHYLGHWLSATAFLINGTGDDQVRRKAEAMVAALNATMGAWRTKYGATHDGYLFPYDPIVFQLLHTESKGCARHLCGIYSVPYYTLHKVMAGLLDHAVQAENALAWSMLLRMAAWVKRHAGATIAARGAAAWQRVLNTEWGGMNEVLFNLYAITNDPDHLASARFFNHWSWSAPLAAGNDDLGGNHANTHIPEVIGNARGYETTANLTDKAIAVEFFAAVTQNHSWVTGGSNNGEYWGAPMRMGDQLNGNTEESCTQYNILKVARHLFLWSANASLADFYERAILNGIVGNQDYTKPTMTSFIYMLPLGSSGMVKPWGSSDHGFPCCWGTLSEQLSKMGDSIYFKGVVARGQPPILYVNLFVSSVVAFSEAGVAIAQESGFPVDPTVTTTLTIAPLLPAIPEGGGSMRPAKASSHSFTIKLRVPAWATAGPNTVSVNGHPWTATPIIPGEYVEISRNWAVDDQVVAHFPMSFAAELLRDDRPYFNGTYAYMYGPLVLAGMTSSRWFVPDGPAAAPSTFLARVDSKTGRALEFEAKGQLLAPASPNERGSSRPVAAAVVDDGAGGGQPRNANATSMQMIPLYAVMSERYSVYFDTKTHTIPFSPDGATIPTDSIADFAFTGGASGAGGPKDPSCSGGNIRTGGPGGVARVELDHPMLAPGYTIDSVALRFRYVAGYTPPAGKQVNASTVSVLLTDASGKVLSTIYCSPPLGNYSYDHFTGYSPPIQVASTAPLNVPNDHLVLLTLEVHNHARNLQIPIDDLAGGFNATVTWRKTAARATAAHEHDGHRHGSAFTHGRGEYW